MSHGTPFTGQPPEPAGGGGFKILLIILGIVGLSTLLCCGGVVGMFYWGASKVAEIAQNMTSHDPAAVRRVTAEIADIDVPAELHPEMMFNLPNPFDAQQRIAWVLYRGPGDASLLIGQFGHEGDEIDIDEVRDAFAAELHKQGEDESAVGDDINVQDTATITRTIRGGDARFVVLRGQRLRDRWADEVRQHDPDQADPPEERVVVEGTFPAKAGRAFFLLQGPDEDWPQERIETLIDSIR